MQNTTLCLISLNNACCCSDSSFLIHQNPLSHYSVIFDFSFDCLPVQFSRCAEGSYSRIFDPCESYPLFRSFKTIQCVNQQSNRMPSSFPISRFRRQRFGYFVSCGSYRLFLTSSFSRRCSTLESECLFQHPCLPRKEVIQPHLPIRLPCYDFTPVIGLTLDGCSLR